MYPRSSAGIPPIDDDISARRVCTGITSEIHIRPLEFLGLAIASHGDHAQPQILDLLVHKVRQAGVDVARADGVDPGEVTPLVRQRARQVDAAGLGHVVAGLLLREIGDVPGHGGGDDEAPRAAVAEVLADDLGAVGDAGEIGLDDLIPGLEGAVHHAGVGGAPRIRDEAVDLAKVLDHRFHELGHVFRVADVELVGF